MHHRIAMFLALLAAGPAMACDMMQFKRVQASAHVHVFEAAEGTTAVVNGNIVAIVGREAILVVDTGQFPSVARRAIAELKALSPAPVRYVVNTHWHGDHLLANSVFKAEWPQARIVAHPHTIERAAFFYTDYAKKTAERLPGVIAEMKKRRESGGEDEKLWTDRTVDCIEHAAKEVPNVTYLAPDTPLEGEMKVDLGGVTAVVKHIGSGNTPGDLIVWVAEDKLVATGDMVVAPIPYAIGSDLEPWTRTLAELKRLDARVIVPGHGPVMRDDTYVRDVDALIAGTRRQLTDMLARGVAKGDAERQLDLADFRAKYVTTPMRREAFTRFYVRPAIAQLWPK
jgi:glyoxylase-like metal-dependent hydrolase (beta-lactamase superfamily II)